MSLTRRFIENRLQSRTEKAKARFLMDDTVRETFESTRNEVAELLERTKYFHGTGAHQYVETNGASKYSSGERQEEDLLTTFVTQGVRPFTDPLNNALQTGKEATTSLTQSSLYARLYAALFQHEDEEFGFEYGSRMFWWLAFCLRMETVAGGGDGFFAFLRGFRKHVAAIRQGRKKRETKKKQSPDEIPDHFKWYTNIRQDDKFTPDPEVFENLSPGEREKYLRSYYIPTGKGLYSAKSDIPGNIPLVLGFDGEKMPDGAEIPNPIASSFEERVGEAIPQNAITHIQASWEHVETVRSRLRELGVDIPVVPIEFVELIHSETSFGELLESHQEKDLRDAEELLSKDCPVPYWLYKHIHQGKGQGISKAVRSFGSHIHSLVTQKRWGKRGAGIMIIDREQDQVFLLDRSEFVNDRGMKAISGGARDIHNGEYESSLLTALGETYEEIGFIPKGNITGVDNFQDPNAKDFEYETFILELGSGERESFEGKLKLNREHRAASWHDLSTLEKLEGVHPGVLATLKRQGLSN